VSRAPLPATARERSHVVLFSYFFPPGRQVGGLRPARVAESLVAAGYRVTVITARLPQETGDWRVPEGNLRVRTIKPWPTTRDVVRRIKHWLTGAGRTTGTQVPATESESPTRSKVPWWKRYLYSFIWLPDDRTGYIVPALRAAGSLRREGIDLIVSSAPPVSVHLAARRFAAVTRLPWIAEFRDPWTSNPWKPPEARSRMSDATERYLEKAVLKAATRVVSVTTGIHQGLRTRLPGKESKFLVIRNGIPALAPRTKNRERPLRIVYVGTFYLGRDPLPFLRALAEVRQQRRLGPEDLVLDLVGLCRNFGGRSVETEVAELGLTDLVFFHDWVPHAKAQELIGSAGLLLLLAMGQPTQVPNKLYEYLGTRTPILAIVDPDGESAGMLEQAGGHYVMGEDPSRIIAALERALDSSPGAGGGDGAILEEWTSERQMAILVKAANDLVRSHSGPTNTSRSNQ
jgi:glycosyltransferase involved in cell wall biosynthesis